MSISRIRDKKGRPRFQFEFSRYIDGQRKRARKMLPASWSQSQADAFDRQESAKLYALATGLERRQYTISEAVAYFLTNRAPELKHGKGMAQELALMLPYYKGKPISMLPEVCEEYTTDHRDNLAPATIKNRLRYLVSCCRYGWKRKGMGTEDPGARVVFPAVNNARHVYKGRADMLRLALACEDRSCRAQIRIAFYSGMRKGELLRAEVVGDLWVLPDTKNGEPHIVPINPKVRSAALVPRPSYSKLTYWWCKARSLTGVKMRFHDWRHSTGSEIINNGGTLKDVQGALNQKSAASANRYSHLLIETKRAALQKVGQKRRAA